MKQKTELRLKLRMDYILSFWHLKHRSYLGTLKTKKTRDKNGENIPHLEIAEVVLVRCNIVNNYYQEDSRVLYTLIPEKPLVNLLEIAPTNFIVLKEW